MLYFIFPNVLMRIIIWFCYQPLLDKNLAGSSVFFFFSFYHAFDILLDHFCSISYLILSAFS